MMEELGEKLGFAEREIEERIEKMEISGEALIDSDIGNNAQEATDYGKNHCATVVNPEDPKEDETTPKGWDEDRAEMEDCMTNMETKQNETVSNPVSKKKNTSQVNIDSTTKNEGKRSVHVTIIDDKEKYSYKTYELGILPAKPDKSLRFNNIQMGENSSGDENLKQEKDNHVSQLGGTGNFMPRPKIELPFFEGQNSRGGNCFDVLKWEGRNVVRWFNKLVQKSSVEDYQEKFEELQPLMLQQNTQLSEGYFVSNFISGLKEELKHNVKVLEPRSVFDAAREAKLYELAMEIEEKKNKQKYVPKNTTYTSQGPLQKTYTTTQNQPQRPTVLNQNNKTSLVEYRRNHNLYFKCGERFNPGHQCKVKQINSMEEEKDQGEETHQEEGLVETKGQVEGDNLKISMNALTGNTRNNTLRIQGVVKGKPVNILIESGSTHNFIIPSDMVLGVDWMKKYSPIVMDFKEMTLSFQHEGNSIVLQGGQKRKFKLILEEKLHKLTKKNPEWIGEIFLMNAECSKTTIPQVLQPLLEEYKEVFEEPKGTPSARQQDHVTILKPEAQPINLRPYRCYQLPSFRPTKALFASPCLLVKKKDGTWRLCVDYRQLNSMTVKNNFPIPVVEEMNWLVQGHFEFKVMPFEIDKRPCHIPILGVSTDQSKVVAMKGLTDYYRKFIKGFGEIKMPLTQMLKKGNFVWTHEEKIAFEKLKEAMCKAPVLALPDFNKCFCLETDAISTGNGVVNMEMPRHIGMMKQYGNAPAGHAREACTINATIRDHCPAPLMLRTGTIGHVYPSPVPVYLYLCPAIRTIGPVLLHLRVAPVANHLLGDHGTLYLRLHMQGISPKILWEFLVQNPRYIPWVQNEKCRGNSTELTKDKTHVAPMLFVVAKEAPMAADVGSSSPYETSTTKRCSASSVGQLSW
ncbi:hypothetical protein GQ457_13G018830 [Hibiscus cannabinus]